MSGNGKLSYYGNSNMEWRYSLNFYGDIEINTIVGEATGKQIGETTLDPNNRIIVQLTMNDCEKAAEIFNKLQGNRKKDADLRKQMMAEYRINKEDLDN